ncbi:MAG: glycosyltransferase family 2 protein [Candidatus Woesearchaeota archaeon]
MIPKVTVLILNWNGKHFLKTCLDALFKSTYKNFDVILLDNASNDGSVEFIKKNYADKIKNKKLKLIISPKNLGFAGGNNEAYKHVSKNTKYVILLNNDTKVKSNWMEEMVKVIEKDPLCGGVCSIDNNILYYKKKWVTYNLVGDPIFFLQNNKNKKFIEAIMLAGCSFLFRKSLVDKPFDDDYFAYAEDMYLSWLLRLKGYSLKYSTKAYFYHFTESTKKRSNKLNKFLLYHGTKNKLMNLFIFYETKNIIKIFPLIFLSQLILNIIQPTRIPISLKAYWWLIINMRRILKKRKYIQAQRKVPDKDLIKMQSYKLYSELNKEIKLNSVTKILLHITNFFIFIYCFMVGLKTREFLD